MEIMLIAPVSQYSIQDCGYGSAATGIASVLERMKQENKITNVYYINTAHPDSIDLPDHTVDVAICMVHPENFLRTSKGMTLVTTALSLAHKRFLSIVWETTPLPGRWQQLLQGQLFDAYITPSYFVADEIQKVCDKPVYYYPHYIDTTEITPLSLSQKEREQYFTAVYIGQYTKRKGMEDAVTAFIRALGSYPDARLIIKYHTMTERELSPEQLIFHTALTNSVQPRCRVYTLDMMLDKNELFSLYRTSSLLLFPSRGEGFGLPIAEAMAVGIPVIYTGWSSMPEVGRAPGNHELPYTLDESVGMSHYGYDTGSRYAIPSMHACIAALRSAYQAWKTDKTAYYEKVQGNRAIIEERFGYDTVSACISHFIHGNKGFAPYDIDNRMRNIRDTIYNETDRLHQKITVLP